jgi:hypothetical protein
LIPSTPRRTWIFLLTSSLAFFGPDLLVPAAWAANPTYLLISTTYQLILVLVWFWFGPVICKALVVWEINAGPLRVAVDLALAAQRRVGTEMPITLAAFPVPFIVTAGLFPAQCQIFLSSAVVERLGADGLRFLLARALAHGGWHQRMVALLPLLAFTAFLPDTPTSPSAWLTLAGVLVGWLGVHWLFELHADRVAARVLGTNAMVGLSEVLAVTASPLGWLSLQPPLRWRRRVVSVQGDGIA